MIALPRTPRIYAARFSLVALAGAAALIGGCTEERKAPPSPSAGGRTQSVLASSAPAPEATKSAAAPEHVPAKTPRKLCDAELAKAGRALPKGGFDTQAANGDVAPEPRLDVGSGRWTWINFFAAWCGPCKEEIPRLRAWEQKLASSLRVRFVSLDDDERQLGRFLEGQPASGVRASLWLKPGPNRDGFLEGLRLRATPTLPAHALVDPQGKVRCAFEGAVDDADYGQIETIVAQR